MNLIHWVLIVAVLVYIGLRLIPGKGWKIAPAYLRIILLCAAAFLTLTPFVWLICSAFKSKDSLMMYTFLPDWNHLRSFPDGTKAIVHWFGNDGLPPVDDALGTLTLANFRRLLTDQFLTPHGPVYFWEYIVNSLFLSCGITSINIFLSSMAGYALAKYRFKGRNIIIFLMLGSMMFPAMLFLAPLYEMISVFGWMDTYLALIVPGAITVFGIFLFRQAMVGVPNSLMESARVDGASEFRIYWEITLPLVRPVTAAYCLITFLGTWNAFLQPQLFIQSQSKLPLPVVLNRYIGMYVQDYGIFLAGTLLAIIPPAILFFVLQKEFVAGLTSGATKG
jgi:ABC-type glycerol-3-phosphate transport system permease component